MGIELDVFGRMYCSASAHVVQAVQPMSCACTQEMKNGAGGWMAQAVECPCFCVHILQCYV